MAPAWGETALGSAEVAAALPQQGHYPDVAVILRIKEVRIGEDERFVICFNPEAAQRAATVRAGRGSTGRWLPCARTVC
jgi:hypothetical protein